MKPEIEKKHLIALRKVAYYASKKLFVEEALLESYLMNKLPRIQKNFVPDLNKDFDVYLTISLRFYCLNYLRDCSFTTKITSKEFRIYRKLNKWKSIKVASRRLGIPAVQLIRIKRRIDQNKKSFDVPLEKVSYQLTDSRSSKNDYSNFVVLMGGADKIKKSDPSVLKQKWEQYTRAA